jgi:hypothetical protein
LVFPANPLCPEKKEEKKKKKKKKKKKSQQMVLLVIGWFCWVVKHQIIFFSKFVKIKIKKIPKTYHNKCQVFIDILLT